MPKQPLSPDLPFRGRAAMPHALGRTPILSRRAPANPPAADPLSRAYAELATARRDAILEAIARSARELLRSSDMARSMPAVLELIGTAAEVERVHLFGVTEGRPSGDTRLALHRSWCDPACVIPEAFEARITGSFAEMGLPDWPERLARGETIVGDARTFPPEARALLELGDIRSTLVVPVFVNGDWWGFIAFDACQAEHQWLPAEVETLGILAELVGAAAAMSVQMRKLSDANRIIENSPTVLYRIQPHPPFALTYLSENFVRLGIDADVMLQAPDRWLALIEPSDGEAPLAKIMRLAAGESERELLEFRFVPANRPPVWFEGQGRAVRSATGEVTAIEGILIDVTERKQAGERIAALARTDALTALPNRPAFMERLELAFARARRGAGDFAVLYLDLDHFKDVNDTLGHPAGDALLREISARLRGAVRSIDLVSRFGGDEFAILLEDVERIEDIEQLAAKIGAAVATPVTIGGNEVNTTSSIGIVPYDLSIEDPESMLSKADLALYRAKDEGRNQYRFHVAELDRRARERMSIGLSLHGAAERGEFELVYQPQMELGTRRITGLEALVRWNHPTRGRLPASAFISVAESNGTILSLGRWVLDEACRQLAAWRAQGVEPPVVGVNVSAAQFQFAGEFDRSIAEALARYAIDPDQVELELTESVLMETTQRHRDAFDRLRDSGVRIAVDDFGTGFSSLAYLAAFRVSRLKLAGQFIEDAATNPANAAIVRATASLSRELGIEFVAEGVTNAQQEAVLKSAGCRYAQGFYYGEPMSPEAVSRLLGHVAAAE